jgi:hypothetical protein
LPRHCRDSENHSTDHPTLFSRIVCPGSTPGFCSSVRLSHTEFEHSRSRRQDVEEGVASQCPAESTSSSYRLHGTRHVLPGIATRSDARWQRLTVSTVDDFIRDLKNVVWNAKGSAAGKGTMVSLYGAFSAINVCQRACRLRPEALAPPTSRWSSRVLFSRFVPLFRKADEIFRSNPGLGNSSAIGPQMVGAVVSAFLDALYKA